MRLFINDHYLHIHKKLEEKSTDMYDSVYEDGVELKNLNGNIVAFKINIPAFLRLYEALKANKYTKIIKFDIYPKGDYKRWKKELKSHFDIINAAGGVVENSLEFLAIYRLGKWDLPKGKIEKGESSEEAALREVEEECGVKTTIEDKITTTWHTYVLGDKDILKKTTWYAMSLKDNRMQQPQLEEQITEIRWLSSDAMEEHFLQTYASIKLVWMKYKRWRSNYNL